MTKGGDFLVIKTMTPSEKGIFERQFYILDIIIINLEEFESVCKLPLTSGQFEYCVAETM